MRDVPSGPASIESAYEEHVSVEQTARLVTRLGAEGADALILGCYGDPGLDALCELTERAVVVGPGAASAHLAAMLGHRFGIVTVAEGVVHPLRRLVADAGLAGLLAGIAVVGVPVSNSARTGRHPRCGWPKPAAGSSNATARMCWCWAA